MGRVAVGVPKIPSSLLAITVWPPVPKAAGEAVAPLTGDLVPEPLLGLTKLRTDPARATALLRALLVLTNLEASR